METDSSPGRRPQLAPSGAAIRATRDPPDSETSRHTGGASWPGNMTGWIRGKPSEEYREFRRMMDSAGREGIRRMIERLTERIEANPHDTEALGVRGLAYAELGKHRRAAEDYGGVIALDPGNAGVHLDRARAYAKLEEHRLAVEDYDAAIRLAPGDAVAHYSRGACKAELGDLAGALGDFYVAILLPPGDADAHYNRGCAPRSARLNVPGVEPGQE